MAYTFQDISDNLLTGHTLSNMAQNRLLSGLLRYLPTSLISYIRNKSGHQPIALKPNSLNGLPIELILSISDLLPPNDILCLSMCDHRLFIALHRKRKSLPRPIESNKVALLHRIERDLPHHFLCHCCLILHKFNGPEHFGLTDVFKLPQNREPPRAFRICSHLRSSHIASLVEPLLPAHIQGASFSQLDGNCDKCNTDFLLEIRDYCGHLALIITRWINLGSGLSPDDWFWKIRSRESYYGDGLALEQDMTWSPRVSYENLSGDWPREALLSRNLSYFKNESTNV
ncbi:unnamed protein product [Penicillium camemberti]|uniref:Str. FM013 n=1 Tax=Penicillium camemberti (strain FM 013) TaxID=1429867 RepID=A0A0G4PA70_PENC3|nr:unnamed protein product [Penicillium camemberti]